MNKIKGKDYLVLIGDWNAAVGEGREDNTVGLYGLGSRNDRREKLVEFCKRHQLVLVNTWFIIIIFNIISLILIIIILRKAREDDILGRHQETRPDTSWITSW